jgi:hypothetical protein
MSSSKRARIPTLSARCAEQDRDVTTVTHAKSSRLPRPSLVIALSSATASPTWSDYRYLRTSSRTRRGTTSV